MDEKRFNVNGVELQAQVGPPDGDPIVFLHFSGANLMIWQPILPCFAGRYRPVLVDLRGHGKSDRPASGYHMDEMARDVAGLLEQMGLERAHVVGSSLGAEVGVALAANHPERVISLVCDGAPVSEAGPYGTWEGSDAEFGEYVAATLERIRSTPDPIYPSVDAYVAKRREVIEKYFGWNEWIEAMARYDARTLADGQVSKSFGREGSEAYMRGYFGYRFEDYYPRVTCPLLILTEEEAPDSQRERAALQAITRWAPQAQIEALPGWQHPYGWLLTPQIAGEAVLRFLGSLAA